VPAHGCLSKVEDQGDEWTVLHARTPGAYVLTSDFDVIPGRSHRGGVCRTSGE
jgi:hypothetical protein